MMIKEGKKRLVLLLCVVMLSIVFAGCGGDAADTGTAPEQQSQKEGENVETADKNEDIALADLLGKGRAVESMSCEYVMSSAEANIEGKYWIKGDSMRSEMPSFDGSGATAVMIYNGDKGETYVYDTVQKQAMRMVDEQVAGDEEVTPLEAIDAVDEELAAELGRETLNGKKCRVIEMTDEQGYTTKMWVWEEYGIPIKVESSFAEGTMVFEYKNISFDNIPDSMFELPADVEVIDLGF